MSKFVQAFLSGIFFTFILDFFLFLGIKLHYTDYYELSALIGFLVVYLQNKTTLMFLVSLFVLVSSVLIPPVGHYMGEKILMTKNVTLKNARHTFVGDIYYDGRKKIFFYDTELQKMVVLDKKELK